MEDFKQWFIDNKYQISIDLAAGSFSGICNIITSHPMDTVKVRMQMSTDAVFYTIGNIIQKEGFKGFYKGMLFPLTSVPVINAVVFSVFEFSKRVMQRQSGEELSNLQNSICGAIAGSCVSWISCPVELAKCKLQMQKDNMHKLYRNPWHCMYLILKNEGINYAFRGMMATQQREILGYAAQFGTYSFLKNWLLKIQDKNESSHFDLLFSGGCAGVACWAVGYPQDTIKTLLQCESTTINHKYKRQLLDGGMIDCGKQIVKQEGIKALWKGFSVCLFRAFYANAIGFYAYELSKSWIVGYI